MKVIFNFKIRWLATLNFKDALTENKKRKHLRGSGEAAKKKQGLKKMEDKWKWEETGSSLREHKTGRLVLTEKF